MSEQFITVRESAQLLGTSEKKIMDMIDSKELQAYRIANQFLRLKKEEVLNIRNSGTVVNETQKFPYTSAERVADFFYFNDFYIFASAIVIWLLYVILYT